MSELEGVGQSATSPLSATEALEALNQLRSNMVATQQASWSNLAYPLVAILDAAGYKQDEPTLRQEAEHLDCYGGAGHYPGRVDGDPSTSAINAAKRLRLNRLALREKGIDPFRSTDA